LQTAFTEEEKKLKPEEQVDLGCKLSQENLLDFCFFTNPIYEDAIHLHIIADALQKIEKGEIKKLMIFVPPRHGKSEITSIRFPAWYLGRNPNNRIIHTSYSATLSNMFSRHVRNLINDERYKWIFNINLASDSRAVDAWDLDKHTGGMISTGVGGSITGYGANLLIIDDPIKNMEEALSETYREKMYDWYRSVALTRLEPNARQIVIMARWHPKDLAGRILEEQKDWHIINLKAIEDNKALWPERFPLSTLIDIKESVGSKVWGGLYQGEPKDIESQIIKREWFTDNYYDTLPPACIRGGGIDTAMSKKTTADHMSLVDACRDRKGFIYVDDVFLEKGISGQGFGEYLVNRHKIYKYTKVKIEENNAGLAVKEIIERVGREAKAPVPIISHFTSTDKTVRLHEVAPLIENGTIKWNRGNKKVAALIEHLIEFDPHGGGIDDDVDALGFAIEAVKAVQGFVGERGKSDISITKGIRKRVF